VQKILNDSSAISSQGWLI